MSGLAGGTPGNYSWTGIDSDVFPHTGYFHHTAIGYDLGVNRAMAVAQFDATGTQAALGIMITFFGPVNSQAG